jgi:Cys-tRNA(Pro)/Cys-tRNA(Cys) deacylase
MVTNNITRLLDTHKISYTVHEYPVEKLSAVEVASLIGAPPEQVYKTIVVRREGKGKPILAVVPAVSEVDLKAVAKALNEKKVILTTQREAEQITGLQSGGISPLALINRGFQVILDASAQKLERMYVSGGQRGLNISLPVGDFVRLVGARFAWISRSVEA